MARTLWVDLDALSDDHQGHLDDGLPSFRDQVGQIRSGKQTFDILLQQVPRGDGVFIWKFSNRTVSQIPEMYSLFGYGFLDKIFPAWFFDTRMFDIYIWEWMASITILFFSYLFIWGITNPIIYFLRKRNSVFFEEIITTFKTPGRIFAWLVFSHYVFTQLNISIVARAVSEAGTVRLGDGARAAHRRKLQDESPAEH